MRLGLPALAAGLLALRFLAELPSVGWLLGMAAAGLLLLFGRLYWLGLFLLGFAWACGSAQVALDGRLAAELDGRTLWLEGRVVDLPASGEGVTRFRLEEVRAARGVLLPERLRLSWRGAPPLMGGERWRLAVTLKRPRGLVNAAGFDYEAWLLAQRVGAVGTVKAGQRLQPASGLDAWRDAWRQRLLAVDAQGAAPPWRRWCWGWLGVERGRVANVPGHRHRASDGHLRFAYLVAGGDALWPGGGLASPGLLAAAPALAALCLRPGFAWCLELRVDGGFRGPGAARLPDGQPGAGLAPAFPPPGLADPAAGNAGAGLAGRAAGQPAGGVLAVVPGGCPAALAVRRAPWALALVERPGGGRSGDGAGAGDAAAGAGPAVEPERSAGQPAGGALDRTAGSAPGPGG